MQELGADEAFDYTAGDFAKHFADKPFDIIVDVVGGTKGPCCITSCVNATSLGITQHCGAWYTCIWRTSL